MTLRKQSQIAQGLAIGFSVAGAVLIVSMLVASALAHGWVWWPSP